MKYGLLPYIFHHPFEVKSQSIFYLSFPLLPLACARTTFVSLLSHILYIFPNGTSFQTNHVVFYTPFGLTCCICLTHDLHSLQHFHTLYIYCFLRSYESLLLCCWFLWHVSVRPLLRPQLFFLSSLFLVIPTDFHLLYPFFV